MLCVSLGWTFNLHFNKNTEFISEYNKQNCLATVNQRPLLRVVIKLTSIKDDVIPSKGRFVHCFVPLPPVEIPFRGAKPHSEETMF